MESSNLVNTLFSNYYSCLKELQLIKESKEHFINNLPGVGLQGVSFEEKARSTTVRYLQSDISDKIKEWEEEHRSVISFCSNVISMCDSWLSEMNPHTRNIFIQRFVMNKTIEVVAKEVGYTQSGLSKRIRHECKKIKIIKVD